MEPTYDTNVNGDRYEAYQVCLFPTHLLFILFTCLMTIHSYKSMLYR